MSMIENEDSQSFVPDKEILFLAVSNVTSKLKSKTFAQIADKSGLDIRFIQEIAGSFKKDGIPPAINLHTFLRLAYGYDISPFEFLEKVLLEAEKLKSNSMKEA